MRPWQRWALSVGTGLAVLAGVVGAFVGAAPDWLVLGTPLLWLGLGGLLRSRLGREGRLAWVGFGLLLAAFAYLFVPGRDRDLTGLLDGYGGLAVAAGTRWAGLGVVTVLVVWIIGAIVAGQRPPPAVPAARPVTLPMARPISMAAAGVGGLVVLVVAIGGAELPPAKPGAKTFTVAVVFTSDDAAETPPPENP